MKDFVQEEASRIALAFQVEAWCSTEFAPKGVMQSDERLYFAGTTIDGDQISWVLDLEGDLRCVLVNGHWLIARTLASRNRCALVPDPALEHRHQDLALQFLEKSKPLFAVREKEARTQKKSKEVIVCGVTLNERQQKFLRILFEHDQEAEQEQKEAWHQGRRRQSASVWRWMTYNPLDSYGLIRGFRSEKLVDRGTGATFKALAEKKLVELRDPPQLRRIEFIVEMKLTTKGRKVCRQLFSEKD